MQHRVYVADSVRRTYFHDTVIQALRADGHQVYDHRNPEPGNNGFRWSDHDPNWRSWDLRRSIDALTSPPAEHAYKLDMWHLESATATVLVLPAGNSAHLELGFAKGRGQRTAILYPPLDFPQGGHTLSDRVCRICYTALTGFRLKDGAHGCLLPSKRKAEMPAELMYKMVDLVSLELSAVRRFLAEGGR
jgi:hypothetical protein